LKNADSRLSSISNGTEIDWFRWLFSPLLAAEKMFSFIGNMGKVGCPDWRFYFGSTDFEFFPFEMRFSNFF
jgi:hypothetical protein